MIDSRKSYEDCIICGKPLREYAIHNRWKICKCISCGFGQTNVTDGDILDFYESDFFDGKVARFQQNEEQVISTSMQWWINNYIKGETLKVLEIGPGPAALIPRYLAKTRSGLSYLAIDVSQKVTGSIRAKGLDVLTGKIYDDAIANTIASQFDYVIGTEVIEHDPNPWQFARAVYSALKPGGRACFTTGNFDGLTARLKGANWHYLDLPAHVCFYTPKSARYIFTKLGFTDVKICCIGFNYIDLYKRLPIPGMLSILNMLQIPTGMTLCVLK